MLMIQLLRIITKTAIHSNFLCAKSKVAPIKQISIPRLELLGCELLTKLIRDVRRAIDAINILLIFILSFPSFLNDMLKEPLLISALILSKKK